MNHSPQELARFLTKMVELARLQPNWDSYGAGIIDRDCVGEAITMYLALPGDWTPVPCSDGGVQLERHAGGFDLEFTISKAAPPR